MFRRGILEQARRALALIAKAQPASGIYLAGGTAAAIHLGHRLSIDLDFFLPSEFDPQELLKVIKNAGIRVSDAKFGPGTLYCIINETKVSFLHYSYPLLEETEGFEGARLASLLDIALMKIIAIASRGSRKDFIDLFFILKKIKLGAILEKFSEKFPEGALEPYHYIKSLTYFDDAENDPMPRMLVACKWDKVKSTIRQAVTTLKI